MNSVQERANQPSRCPGRSPERFAIKHLLGTQNAPFPIHVWVKNVW